jgi:hypothetical protein
MGKKKPPKAPDPFQVAKAQADMNWANATSGQLMSMVDQEGPDGGLSYVPTGSYHEYTDPFTKQVRRIPAYKAVTRLSPEQQAIKERADAAQLNLAGLLKSQTGKFQGILDQPFSLENQEVENTILGRMGGRVRDQVGRDRESMEADMLARGIRPGSEAYAAFKQSQGQKENDAWNQLYLNARGQAINEKLTERNQPFNEFAALLSGTQIDKPSFVNTPGANPADVDYAGLVNQNYQNKLAAWQSDRDRFDKGLGAALSIGAKAIAYSDRRLKEDVRKVGETEDDIGIYTYRYKSGGPLRLGLIAQDVEKKRPEAVSRDTRGYRRVDYRKALHLGD